MISIQNRITAFAKLGDFLGQYSIENIKKIDRIEHNEIFFDGFLHQIKLAQEKNSWFTKENILFSRPDATQAELLKAVEAGYVDEFTDRFEDGLDTLIGERGVKLSGGQRQRIAIARAILADPKIIILDEATSNLDTESESLIQKSLETLTKNRTTIVIAHRLSTIKRANQILVIENGEIAEQGDHTTLIEKQGRYYDLYTYQAKI